MLQLVPLLPASTSTLSTELLGLCSPRVRNQKTSVVCDQLLLELHGAEGVDILGVVRNDRLCNRLAESVDLRSVSTTLHAETDVDSGEGLFTGDKDRFIDLEAQELRLEEGDGGAVDVDEAASLLRVGDRSSGLLHGQTYHGVNGACTVRPTKMDNIPSFCQTSERPAS